MKSLFEYEDYKAYLGDIVRKNAEKRGYLTKLADAAGCRKSYLSQVLRSKVQLTPEHAARLCSFWELNPLETEYFLNLVSLGRTDFPPLQKMLKKRMTAIKNETENLSERFAKTSIDGPGRELYYSSWIYSAIHILTSIPTFNNVASISQRLSLHPDAVKEALFALEKLGLVRKTNQQKWELGVGSIHLPQNSPLTPGNHLNWRTKACVDVTSKRDGIHYTSVQTLSLEDFLSIKQSLLSMLDRCRKQIEPSPPEELVCLNLDFFKV